MTEPLVGHADDGVVGNVRVLGERVFNRTRVNVLSSGNDHVVFPANDEQPTRIIEIAHVAGAGHVVDDGFGAAAGVTLRRQLAADEYPSGDVWSDGLVVVVEDRHRAAGDRLADRFRGVPQVGRRRQRADADLGGAVAVVEDVAVAVHKPLREAGIEPITAGHHHPQCRHRVSRPHIVGQVEDARQHDRHRGERVGAMTATLARVRLRHRNGDG